jgi:glycosyltransferase involved in cell wall biosynthesis
MRILIATAGQSDLLCRTLDELVACDKPESFAGVVLVENGGEPTASDLEQTYKELLKLQYHFEPMGNKNRALNRGLSSIKSGLVVLFDDDVRIDPQTLMAYQAASERFPESAFFGGHCQCDYEVPPADYLAALLPYSAKGWSLSTDAPIDLPHALGFNWAIRAEAVIELGGFIEDRGPGTAVCVGDEYQMQKRLIQKFGPGRFVEDAKVWHNVPISKCNDTWLIKRGYDYGVAKAMDDRDDGAAARVPSWAWRRLVTSTLKWLVARLVPSEAFRLQTSYGRAINSGIVDGYRLETRQKQRDVKQDQSAMIKQGYTSP